MQERQMVRGLMRKERLSADGDHAVVLKLKHALVRLARTIAVCVLVET